MWKACALGMPFLWVRPGIPAHLCTEPTVELATFILYYMCLIIKQCLIIKFTFFYFYIVEGFNQFKIETIASWGYAYKFIYLYGHH